MSKDHVWKIIFFFHSNRPKNFFPDSSRLESDQTFFHIFQDSIGNQATIGYAVFSKLRVCTSIIVKIIKIYNYFKDIMINHCPPRSN